MNIKTKTSPSTVAANAAARTLAAGALVSAMAFGAAGCQGNDASPVQAEPAAVQVEVRLVEMRTDTGVVQAIGRVKNLRESTIASRVMGKVARVSVKSGDRVKAGQLLLRIDDRDASGRVAQARGALAQATAAEVMGKQMLTRLEKLKTSEATSQAKYDKAVFDHESARGAVAQARGALNTAESYLAESRVVAPFAGTIVNTLIEPGEMASPGYPLLRMEGGEELEFEATVTAHDVSELRVGDAVTVTLDVGRSERREVVGTLSEIVPSQDRVTHTQTVRIRLENTDGVRSGMFGRATFTDRATSCPGIRVPADLMVHTGQLSAVYIVDDVDRIRLRLIKEGRRVAETVEVLAGLRSGDRLVVSDRSQLIDGQPAQVVQP